MTESFVNDLRENDKGEIYLLRFCDTNVEAISSVYNDDLQQLWLRRQLQSILKCWSVKEHLVSFTFSNEYSNWENSYCDREIGETYIL